MNKCFLQAMFVVGTFFLCVSQAFPETIAVQPRGEYKNIDVQLTNETLDRLGGVALQAKEAAVSEVLADPDKYAPPVLYAISAELWKKGDKDEAVFWFFAGQLRARFDAQICLDKSARSAVGILDNRFGPPLMNYLFQDLEKFKKVIQAAADWDERTPYNYDHRWINLHGMNSISYSLSKNDKSRPVLSLPKEEWVGIAKKNRQEFIQRYESLYTPEMEFFIAAKSGDKEKVRMLVEKGADVNSTKALGLTPLEAACAGKHREVAQYLLDKGANINALDKNGNTVLIQSILANDSDTINFLLGQFADINMFNKSGVTALMTAVMLKKKDIVGLLLERGASKELKNAQGMTAVDYASGGKNSEIYMLLNEATGKTQSLENAPSVDLNSIILKFVLGADVFRNQAATDLNQAIDKFGSDSFKDKWAKQIQPFFTAKTENNMLRDFFSGAVIFLGRLNQERSVVAFYNPWIDGLLLVEAKINNLNILFEDFKFISGESLRGEILQDPQAALSLYTLNEPLILALATRYSKVVSIINSAYPITGEFILVDPAIEKRLGTEEKEFVPILTRMLYRVKMYDNYFSEVNRSALSESVSFAKKLKSNNFRELSEFLSLQQDKEMLKSICMLSQDIRERLAPVYFLINKEKQFAVVALVNSRFPRWVVVSQINLAPDELKRTQVEMFDLELSSKILHLIKNK